MRQIIGTYFTTEEFSGNNHSIVKEELKRRTEITLQGAVKGTEITPSPLRKFPSIPLFYSMNNSPAMYRIYTNSKAHEFFQQDNLAQVKHRVSTQILSLKRDDSSEQECIAELGDNSCNVEQGGNLHRGKPVKHLGSWEIHQQSQHILSSIYQLRNRVNCCWWV